MNELKSHFRVHSFSGFRTFPSFVHRWMLAVLLLGFPILSRAGTLVYEGFNYTPGNSLTNDSVATVGDSFGWGSRWGGTALATNVAGSMSYDDGHGHTLVTDGGSVIIGAPAGTTINAQPVRSFNLGTLNNDTYSGLSNGTYWVSFLMQWVGPQTAGSTTNLYGRKGDLAVRTGVTTNNSAGSEVLTVGSPNAVNRIGTSYDTWALWRGPDAVAGTLNTGLATAGISLTNSTFVVMKLVLDGTSSADTAYLWLNWTNLNVQPPISLADATNNSGDMDGFNSLRFDANGGNTLATNTVLKLDEIRVGDSFGGVMPFTTHPTRLAIISVNSGSNPGAIYPFNVVVQAQGDDGTAQNVIIDTTVTLTLNTGSGTLGGTITGIITAGSSSVTITGVTYSKVENGVSLTVSRTSGDSLVTGNSSSFNVISTSLLIYEGFNYAAGISITNQTGGTGWGANWSATGNPQDVSTNLSGSMNYGNLQTAGGSVTFGPSSAGGSSSSGVYMRQFTNTLGNLAAASGSTNMWLSLLYLNTTNSRDVSGYYGEARLGLYSGVTAAGGVTQTGGTTNVLNFGTPATSATVADQISLYSGTNIHSSGITTPRSPTTNLPALLLLRMIVDNTSANDTVYLWVNPDLTLGEPSIATANASWTTSDISSVNAIRFQQSGANGGVMIKIDEIRVSSTFTNVTPLSKLAITQINGGASPTVGANFSVVVQAQNDDGSARTVTSNTAVSLSLNTGSGALGGTLNGTILAGNSSVTIGNVTYSKAENGVVLTATRTSGDPLASGNGSCNVSRATVTISSGLTANSKVYNGSTAATINSNTVALSGVLAADTANVRLSTNGYAATFSSAAAGNGKTVTVSGLTLAGAAAGNYTLTQPSLSANITAKTLTVSGVTANNKVYDGGLVATVSTNGATLAGVVGADVVTLSGTAAGTFATKIIGTGKTVTVSGLTLAGVDAGNYTLTQPTATANITTATLTVTGVSASNKVYDGTTTATVITNGATLVGVAGGDVVSLSGTASGVFNTSAVASGKTVTVSGLTLAGADAANYTLTQPTATANITAATLTITANNTNRIYGASNPTFTASYSGFVSGENASVLSGSPSLNTAAGLSSSVAGSPYAITVTNGTLSASNYVFAFVAGQLTITRASSASVVSTSANPSPTGSNVTFTATLTAVAPSSGTPTGTTRFLVDGAQLGASATLSAGVATLVTNSLSHGQHTVAVEYAGDGNFFGITNSLSPNQTINTAPRAANDTFQRYPTSGMKLRIATLLADSTDTDGDSLTLSSINAASAQGGSVVVSNSWIFYTPSQGFTNADSFAYVISDGALQATGSVAITIVSNTTASLNLLSIDDMGQGSFRSRFQGIPGRSYTIQSTTNLVQSSWQSRTAATANIIGYFEYTDANVTNPPTRFYRSTYP